MPPITKAELRQQMLRQRKAQPKAARQAADVSICEQVLQHVAWHQAERVLAYAPLPSEVDTTPLLHAALAQGKALFLPRSAPSGHMVFCRVNHLQSLVPGLYGIAEPPPASPPYAANAPGNASDLCLVPGVAFAPNGQRLGYGKGYYDRFLVGFAGVAVGLCRAPQVLPQLPHEPCDIPVHELITEASAQHGL